MFSKKIKDFFYTFCPYIILLLLCMPAIFPLFHSGFFSMHDDEQIARLYELDQSVKATEIPPRWVSNLGFGFGYPLFNFYPPLVYYFGEAFHLLGFTLIDSTKIVMGLGFLLSALFMFLWVRKYAGNLGGIVAAVLYIYAPYHGVDIYVRGAMAEFFSFVWLPAVFWSIDKVADKKSSVYVLVSSIFLACMVLTHNLIALPFAFFLITYIIFVLIRHKNEIAVLVPRYLIIGIISLGLSAYFWLPALAEKQYTLVDIILTRELANYAIHFVYIGQFWNSPWGYTGSVAGSNDGLTFQVGKFQLLLSFLTGIVSVYFLCKRKKENTLITFGIFGFFSFSLFMTTSYSKPIWDALQPLAYLQFPWRFLEFSAVFAAFLGGICIVYIKKIFGEKITLFIGGFIILGSILFIVRYFHPQMFVTDNDNAYIANNDIQWRVSSMSFEYVPKGVSTHLSAINTTHLTIEKKDIPKKSFQVVNGNIAVAEEINKPSYKKYTVSGTGGIMAINTYMFPGWQVSIDGRKEQIIKYGKLQLISFSVPSGNHTIEVSFKNTPVRTIGNFLSIIAFCMVVVAILYSYCINNAIIKKAKSLRSSIF